MPNSTTNPVAVGDRDFNAALLSFYEGCQRISDTDRQRRFPSLNKPDWRLDELIKRWRIVRDSGVHCFVDKATGDVLKAETWSKPAKHARGNIFDEHNGLNTMGPYGPAYLR